MPQKCPKKSWENRNGTILPTKTFKLLMRKYKPCYRILLDRFISREFIKAHLMAYPYFRLHCNILLTSLPKILSQTLDRQTLDMI